jgi:hypothetical protein
MQARIAGGTGRLMRNRGLETQTWTTGEQHLCEDQPTARPAEGPDYVDEHGDPGIGAGMLRRPSTSCAAIASKSARKRTKGVIEADEAGTK